MLKTVTTTYSSNLTIHIKTYQAFQITYFGKECKDLEIVTGKIIDKVFKKKPELAEGIESALGFMGEVTGKEKRRTGERISA